MCLQLKVGSHLFVVGHLAYYMNWIDYPQNRNTVIAAAAGGGGGLILLIIIVVIIVLCVRKSRRRKHQRQASSNTYITSGILCCYSFTLNNLYEIYEM